MLKDVTKGHTLLTKGPARITLLEGKIEVFGKIFTPKKSEEENTLIIPGGNKYPLYAVEKSKMEVYTSIEDNLINIEENTISPKWMEIKDEIISEMTKNDSKPIKIMVLGISSGKTTFLKYLANNFLQKGFKGGYLDSDLGQQIIYIPTTINIGTINDYLVTSEDITSEKTVFIGATFPKGDNKFIVSHSCKDLISDYTAKYTDADFILIDSDGWIKTEAGILYKNFFIKTLNPDILIVFHDDLIEELDVIEKTSTDLRKDRKMYLITEENKYFYEKDKEERRFLRQSQFSKKFEEFRKISIPLDSMEFIKTEYDKETDQIVEKKINVNDLVNLPYHYVIIGLMSENSELIEIGLLFTINIEKNYILLYSDFSYKEQLKVKKILLGSLRLSTKGNHQGYLYL